MNDKAETNVDSAIDGAVGAISDLISFQQGGITSRTLIETPSSTVTLFAFDEGQALSEHSAPFNALVQVTQGELEITLAGQPHSVKAGELIVMPADVPHALRALQRSTMILTMARG